jgi:NADH-quinone oxidoreductase subunit N
MISYAYFEQREERKEEYYILLVLGAMGALILAISKHFASLFLGLEILSVTLYSMVAYLRKRPRSDEAGIKYLMVSAFSSAFLLFGMALVYLLTGTMDFSGIASYMNSLSTMPVVLLAGFGLMVVGVGFKLAIVPFHLWAADVYEGAPVPVDAFIASVSKGGMVILLVRFFNEVKGYNFYPLVVIFSVMAVASMLIGNLLALRQNNVKRILAYSSIAHMGYLLVAFLAGGNLGVEAVTFYLVAYFITSVAAFGIMAMLSDHDRDAEWVEDYKGLFWRKPWTAAALTTVLLSLAGIPLTAGFIGKFYLLAAGVNNGVWWLVFFLVGGSVVGLFYYIRIIATMFEASEKEYTKALRTRIYFLNGFTLSVLVVALVWLGVYPDTLIGLVRSFLVP